MYSCLKYPKLPVNISLTMHTVVFLLRVICLHDILASGDLDFSLVGIQIVTSESRRCVSEWDRSVSAGDWDDPNASKPWSDSGNGMTALQQAVSLCSLQGETVITEEAMTQSTQFATINKTKPSVPKRRPLSMTGTVLWLPSLSQVVLRFSFLDKKWVSLVNTFQISYSLNIWYARRESKQIIVSLLSAGLHHLTILWAK